MIKIETPQIDNISLWDRIVSNKKRIRREKLILFREQVKERYLFYEDHINNLDEIQPLEGIVWDQIKLDLLSCYGDNIAFKQVKKEVFSDKPKCPYCMINRPNTLDHYFDKDDYPEYSVYIPNLVPCCSECNYIKGTNVFGIDQQRKFIHFYYDEIPNYQFLFARFSFSEIGRIPLVEVYLQFLEDDVRCKRIETHFTDLGLLPKYRIAIIDRLASILKEIQFCSMGGSKEVEIRSLLDIRYRALVGQYGCNYWEACIFEGLMNSAGFLERYLE